MFGPSSTLLEEILSRFSLDGEAILRKSNLKIVRPPSYTYGTVTIRAGLVARYYQIKFALLHGFLPTTVDHRNRDSADHSASNLRAATKSQNAANAPGNGVSRKRLKWRAYITVNNRQINLGTFACFGQALARRKKAEKEYWGEFAPR